MVSQMVRPLLMALLLVSTQAKAAKESCDAQVKQLAELTAKLKAVEQHNVALTKQISDAGDVPYVSTQFIVDSLAHVTDAALGKDSLNVDLSSVYTAADAGYGALSQASEQATVAASKGYAASTDAYGSASKVAQDLYKEHVSSHTGQYYDAAMEAYTQYGETHVGTIRKAYNENLHSHVNMATEKLYAGYGAAVEGSKTAIPKVWDVVQLVKQSIPSAGVGKQLAFLVQEQTFTVPVLNRKVTFNYGYLDGVLMLVQALVAAYIGVQVIWRLFLRTIVWNIGIKILGREVCLRLSMIFIKVSLKLTRFFVSLALSLVLTALSWALCWFILGLFGVLGVVLLHVFENGVKVGLKPGMRLALGLCFGLLFGFIFQSKFCKRRKASSAKNNNVAKTDSKKAAAPPKKADTKQAAKPVQKKK